MENKNQEITQEDVNRIANKIIDIFISEKLTVSNADDILHAVRRTVGKSVSLAVKTEMNKIVSR